MTQIIFFIFYFIIQVIAFVPVLAAIYLAAHLLWLEIASFIHLVNISEFWHPVVSLVYLLVKVLDRRSGIVPFGIVPFVFCAIDLRLYGLQFVNVSLHIISMLSNGFALFLIGPFILINNNIRPQLIIDHSIFSSIIKHIYDKKSVSTNLKPS